MRRRLLLAVCIVSALAVRSSALQAPPESSIQLRIGFVRPGGGYTIETIPLETYVARVLAGEIWPDSPPASLEALAIAIRTYALGNLDRHKADGFDLCSDTHCQVVRNAVASTIRAAQATAGQVMTRNNAVATVYYSASCGGRTEIPSDVWPDADDPSYLPTLPDEACEGFPHWDAELSEADLLRAFHAAGFTGDRLQSMEVAGRNSSGRVAHLRLAGLTPPEISGQDLRMAVGPVLGWQYIKSTLFELSRTAKGYRFVGRGSGHGVGLCVIGSINLAARGTGAAGILQKYFPGTVIAPASRRIAPEPPAIAPEPPAVVSAPPAIIRTPAGPVLVSLPDGDAPERPAITSLALQARDDVARALGVSPPPELKLHFHSTMADYERATGRPWFTSGAWIDNELHLPPIAVMRERDVVERTIRRELVHAMADPTLKDRRAWVREGAAIYFAAARAVGGTEAQGQRPELRGGCPGDRELQQPISAGALADAYARASACFARQIEAGKKWQDVR